MDAGFVFLGRAKVKFVFWPLACGCRSLLSRLFNHARIGSNGFYHANWKWPKRFAIFTCKRASSWYLCLVHAILRCTVRLWMKFWHRRLGREKISFFLDSVYISSACLQHLQAKRCGKYCHGYCSTWFWKMFSSGRPLLLPIVGASVVLHCPMSARQKTTVGYE